MSGDRAGLLPIDRFLYTLDIVSREGQHLIYSWGRLYSQTIDAPWVRNLDNNPEIAERLEAFVSRFGRMQDTMADKLLPRWLMTLAETPGSQIETLNRAEKLGVLENVEHWLEARKLRNRLIHEYMENEESFSEDLALAKEYSIMLITTYRRLRQYAIERMNIDETKLPADYVLS
ncbi:hypothetical protein MNBD_GAMMA01-797 [hydrothermal vent metagenome]|uniref:Uncharacterized protein n=1 Tax=hydrothermal vent metagenome TaxID=652676 RepID=A0A3B0VBD5_9ZZZZ